MPLSEIGVKRWHHDSWFQIIQAAIDGHPDQVILNWHPNLSRPAAMRYSASSPHMLAWLDKWNDGKPYAEQIRPFGFLLSYTAKAGVFAEPSEASIVNMPRRGRPAKADLSKPIAPYDSDPVRALSKVFDRVSGEPIEPDRQKSYADALAQYHLSCENKFANGQFLNWGRTERRHVVATEFVFIGKEANRIAESGEPDSIVPAVSTFTRTKGHAV